MSGLALFNGLEVTEPKLPDVFDYDASVIKLQDLRDKTGEGFKKLMRELWIARECLAVRTGRPRKVKTKGPKTRSWMEYLNEIGMARSTAHKWLTMFFPDRERKMNLPTKTAPKLPPNSSTPERVMTPKEAEAGLKDPALETTMGKSEWTGGNQDQPPAEPNQGGTEKPSPDQTPKDELDASICQRLSVLKVKINRHTDAAKVQAAQKLLSELFILFSEA